MPIQPPPALKAGPFGTRGGARLGPQPTDTKLPPPKAPSGLRIEHRVGIQAPAEVIWEVISDLESWGQWCALYPVASGDIRIGAVLDLTLALPGRPVTQIRPTVLEWVPGEQLHWKLTMLGGLVKTIRYFEIESLAEASCIVSNGEIIGGLIGPRLGKAMSRTLYRAFVEMNEALKARAEAVWQARKD
ncbi:SRPBCC family protein [Phenylobacterium sp.]|uniref:SRPBCC family protein n=1 Tax=Phenylobacterium sp. TaxID=1871053 RepID=UPI00374D60C9